MSVFEDLRKVVMEIKDLPEEKITLESTFTEDLEADSLDVVEMLMILEEKYDIIIPEEIVEEMKTVKDVVDYIETRLKDNA